MQDFRKRRNRAVDVAKMVVGAVGVLALAFVCLVAVRASWGMYGKFTQASDAHAAAARQLEELRAERVQVAASAASFTTERGIEGQLRERYGVARPGEGVITIVRQGEGAASVLPPQRSLWERLWHALSPF